MQKKTTGFRVEALRQSGRRTLSILLLLVFALVALGATGAEARHSTSAARQSLAKKKSPAKKTVKSITAKKKPYVLPAAAIKKTTYKKQTFSGISLPGVGDERQLRSELEKYIGIRYKPGGTGRDGFDCSGFARSMYRKLFGIDMPHNAQSQFQLSSFSKLDASSLQTGDLIFFASTAKKKRINHVGIYLEDGQFIHAQSRRGVVVSSIDDDHWRNRLVSGKRLDNKKLQLAESFDSIEDSGDDFEEIEDEVPSGLQVKYSKGRQSCIPRGGAALQKSSSVSRQQFVELNYVRPVFGKYCNLQVGSFREDFDMYADDTEMPVPVEYPYGAWSEYSYSQGVRIASDFKPFQWMSITPSFMYYDHGHALDSFEMPQRSFGLDVNLESLDAGWSLSTGLRYASLKSAALRSAQTSDPNLLDLSLTYSQRLNSRMQLSFMGQSLRSSLTQRAEDADSGISADQRVFFMLNYNY